MNKRKKFWIVISAAVVVFAFLLLLPFAKFAGNVFLNSNKTDSKNSTLPLRDEPLPPARPVWMKNDGEEFPQPVFLALSIVVTGGRWEWEEENEQTLEGYFRILVFNDGWERVYSRAYIEQLALDGANHDVRSVGILTIEEINSNMSTYVSRAEIVGYEKPIARFSVTDLDTGDERVFDIDFTELLP